ncbi:unnamed protein product [Ambrosiozyma monospora]|uniref:Unnamed protein product n=1 Tax=Ambrosiozyma monospora TaxID=43982 RepID=A0A9W7DH34_AMBMO|nr:unnamed protein product [Ambrosiozyma monospora]
MDNINSRVCSHANGDECASSYKIVCSNDDDQQNLTDDCEGLTEDIRTFAYTSRNLTARGYPVHLLSNLYGNDNGSFWFFNFES